jgi:hypothetical protein
MASIGKLFSASPETGLKRAEAERMTTIGQLEELQRERAALLTGAEDVSAIAAIDAKLRLKERTIAILGERIDAFRAQIREQRRRKIEERREAAIDAMARKLDARKKVADDLVASATKMAECFFALQDLEPGFYAEWPAELPLPRFDLRGGAALKRELSYLLYGLGRPRWNSECQILGPQSPIAVAGMGPTGVAELIAGSADAFLRSCFMVPISDERDSDETEAA